MLNLCAPERTVRRNTHLALVLTAIAGILNSVGFVAVATYTSHMTGIVASMADAAVLHAPGLVGTCLLYTSPSPRDATLSRMPSSA